MKAQRLILLIQCIFSEVYYEETFAEDSSLSKWTTSTMREDYGKTDIGIGKIYGDEIHSKGLMTMEDHRFYALSSKFDKPVSNKGKDLVIQFAARLPFDHECGGGYIKILPDFDPVKFDGDSAYNIMFGPDICGSNKKIHVILNHGGKNHELKKSIYPPDDVLTHQYTLILKSDKSYKVMLDNEEKATGILVEDWDFLEPKEIDDPNDQKPSDWVEDEMIDDPQDKKPEGWDDVEESIPDKEAKKPEEWDDYNDGDWDPPQIPNPDYKGPWSPKRVKNPLYKGEFVAKRIPNPDYKEDATIGEYDNNYVGFDLWQVKSGIVFTNILVTDSKEYAREFSDKYFVPNIEMEKEALKKHEDEKKEKEKKEQDDFIKSQPQKDEDEDKSSESEKGDEL